MSRYAPIRVAPYMAGIAIVDAKLQASVIKGGIAIPNGLAAQSATSEQNWLMKPSGLQTA